MLIGAGLVDSDLTWSGGEDHLVITGDFIDRGVGDRPLMDLLRKLQSESSAAGGRVHVLLGNHEVMNLLRDNRYVNPKTYNSFREDERKEVRKRAWRAFSAATLEPPATDNRNAGPVNCIRSLGETLVCPL